MNDTFILALQTAARAPLESVTLVILTAAALAFPFAVLAFVLQYRHENRMARRAAERARRSRASLRRFH